ncbi:MAG: c-type cytochrome, partial [Pirellulales bacterium]
SKPETILETTGTVGFSPVDLAVGPEGDLFVAVGGRGTEGGVFRVRHTGSTDSRRDISISGVPFDMLAGVLNAPQPLSSWSRAEWVPYAKEIGRPAFVRAAGDNRRTAAERIRAIEIVVELFQGLLVNEVPTLIADDQPQVVARAAWALGRAGQDAETERQLAQLTHHADPRVQRATWEALATFTQLTKHSADARWSVLSDRVERRIRAAAHLADVKRYTRHPLIPLKGDTTGPRAVAALWQMKHRGTLSLDHFGQAAATASATQDNALRLECIRLCQIALNDVNSAPAKPDVYAGYLPNGEPKMGENIRRWAQTMASIFPTDDADTNRELSRLLGMVRLKDPALLARIVAQIAEKTSVAEDVHYLIVLSLLEGNRDAQVTRNTAASLCQLHHKLRDLELYTSRNWPLRVGETLEQLCSKDPALADAVLQDPQFGLAEHSFLLERMSGDTLRKGSESLVERILDTDEEDRVSAQLVNTIARLPHQKSFPLLRKLWPIVLLRDAIVIQLASHPKEQDRSHLAEGLDSVQPEVVLAAAKALAQLRDSQAEGEWKAAASALRRACLDPAQKDSRSAIQALLQHWTSEEIRVSEQKQKDLRDQYQPWFDLIVQRFPQLATVNDSRDVVAWQERAAEIDWSVGDADAGKEVFRQRACAGCHGRTNRIGPSLAEVGKRSSIADLLIAIVDPHRDVSPAYQATLLETATGKTYRGVIVYESPDATLLQTSAETTIRITGQEILSQRRSALSLMPTGLLAGATDRQVADLVAYLRSLRE